MTIQEPGMCSSFFQSVSNTATQVADWCGNTVQSIGSTIGTYAEKAADVAKPYFDKMKEFVSENRGPIILVVAALAIGAIAYAIINSVFCSNTAAEQPPAPPATPSTVAAS